MKKNSFIEGAFIATLGIIIVKVIGLLYVVPFKMIVGTKGGALYGYAYNIYQLFLAISSAGLPFAISKITSEYLALDDATGVKRTYEISTKLIFYISFIAFLVLFIFAPQIAKFIIGSATGGNTPDDIAFVIRAVSFAILVVPFLSVTKGFLQGNKYISPTSISQVIEQVIRIVVILAGSYIALRILGWDLKYAIGIAVSGAFFGGLLGYLYLRRKIKKNYLLPQVENSKDKKLDKEIIGKIIKYSIPFIAISVIYTLYNTVDMILISRTMGDILKMPGEVVEANVSIFTTWGIKLNSILLAVTTGITTSLIPNIVDSFVKKDQKAVDDKFNKTLQCCLLVIVPATIYLSILSEPVWTLFYGKSEIGPNIYNLFVFGGLLGGIHSVIVNTLQGINKYKLVIISVFTGLLINTILDVPLMLLMYKLGLEVSYGAIIAAMIGYSTPTIISLIILGRKYNFSFIDTIKKIPGYALSWTILVGILLVLKIFIPTNLDGRLIQIPILAIYGIASFSIYLVINYFLGNLKILKEIRKSE